MLGRIGESSGREARHLRACRRWDLIGPHPSRAGPDETRLVDGMNRESGPGLVDLIRAARLLRRLLPRLISALFLSQLPSCLEGSAGISAAQVSCGIPRQKKNIGTPPPELNLGTKCGLPVHRCACEDHGCRQHGRACGGKCPKPARTVVGSLATFWMLSKTGWAVSGPIACTWYSVCRVVAANLN